MRRIFAIAAILITASCATAPSPVEDLSPREREVLLLREVDRTRKSDVARMKQLVTKARREGMKFLSRQETDARNRSIELHRSLIGSFPDNRKSYMAEASFRLAELLFETERERIRRVMEEEGAGADLLPDFGQAIEAYREVVKRFPDHPLVEDALYGLAYCYTEQGDPDRAASEYARLIGLFPGTRYALEIHMRLGEYYFEMEDLRRAIEHYMLVSKSGDEIYTDKALYKLGWCYYNLDSYEKAVETFFTLLDYDLSRGTPSDSLADESVDIIARSYAEKGGTPALVRRIAKRKEDPRSSSILLRLAEIYKDRSLYPEAVGTFRTYTRLFPQDRELPSALAQLGESYHIRGDDLAALDLTESYPALVGPSSPWYVAATQEERDETVSWLLGNLESASERRRARFLAGGTKSELEKALNDIDAYHEITPAVPPCRIRHLKGQILAELEIYPDAAVTLNDLASAEDCGEWAANSSIQSVNFQIGSYEREKTVDLGLLESSVDILLSAAPDDPAAPKALLAMGEISANMGNRSESRTVFARLLRTYPKSHESITARLNIARTFFQESNFRQSAAWFKEAWRKSEAPEEMKEARRLHIYSRFKNAEEMGRQSKTMAAAEKFEGIFRMFPDADVAQVSLYNAGKLYRQMGLEMRATDLFEELASVYKESDLALEALQMSVLILEALGDPIRAGVDALALADRSSGEARRSALVKSADLFRAGGSPERAALTRKKAVDEFREPVEGLTEQLFELGQDLESAGRWDEAKRNYLETVNVHRRHIEVPLTLEHAAKAQLRIAQESFSRYQAVTIKPPIEETVTRKRELLQEVIRNFVDAGTFKVAEVSTASNFFLGSALEQFKDEILDSPRPDELTREELEEYVILLQELAYPFEEKALKAYRVNIERAVELEILDKWIEKSYHRMAELAPWAYLREEKLFYPFTAVKPKAPGIPPAPPIESIMSALASGGGREETQSR